MIVLHDAQDQSVEYPLVVDDDKWFILHKLDGEDELEFELSLEDEMTAKIFEEMLVDANGNQYVVKNVDEHSNFMTVTCIVNLDDFKSQFFRHVLYRNATLVNVLNDILPSGWSLSGDLSLTRRATIGSDDGVATYDNMNAYDVLFLAQVAFGVTFNFNAITKTLTVIDRSEVESSGSYLMEDLNLVSVGYVGSTKDFATRLYAYGKVDETTGDNLTFASINDGKEYVEDHSYSNKVISIGWTDERYTVKENLLEDARKKLEALASPVRSYACNAKNVLDDVYVTKVITLVDRRRRQRVDHMIVEWKEYSRSDMDVITLSQSQPTITRSLNERFEELSREVNMGDTMMKAFVNDSIQNATDAITGNNGGVFKWIFDAQGRPTELLNLGDTYDPSTAQKVWRWNAAGLGHSNTGYNGTYDLALLADGSINASVITTGILNADVIRAGKIQDLTLLNYWDLETGIMQFGKGRITSADGKNYWEVQGGALHIERGEIGGFTIASDKIYNDQLEFSGTALLFKYDGNEIAAIYPQRLVDQSSDGLGQLQVDVPVYVQVFSKIPYQGASSRELLLTYDRRAKSLSVDNIDDVYMSASIRFLGSPFSSSTHLDIDNVRITGSYISGDGINSISGWKVYANGLLLYGQKTGFFTNKNGGVISQRGISLTYSSTVDAYNRLPVVLMRSDYGFSCGRANVVQEGETESIAYLSRLTENGVYVHTGDPTDNRILASLSRSTTDRGILRLYDASVSAGDYIDVTCEMLKFVDGASGLSQFIMNTNGMYMYDSAGEIDSRFALSSTRAMHMTNKTLLILGAPTIGVGDFATGGGVITYYAGRSGSVRVQVFDDNNVSLGYKTVTFTKGFMTTAL